MDSGKLLIGGLATVFILISLWSVTQQKAALPCERCNVIVIGLDAWQAAHVHHLGYERDTTPTVDVLAERGITFTNAIAPASWTVPSFMSIMTGTFPTMHGVVNKFAKFSATEQKLSNLKDFSPSVQTLAEVLKENGYATAGFTGDAGVSGKFGYNSGFDRYVDDVSFGGFERNISDALLWAEEQSDADRPFFLFFHGYDAHGQFAVPPTYESRFVPPDYDGPFRGTPQEQASLRERGLAGENLALTEADIKFWRAWYDGKIRDADERLARFVEGLRSRGLTKNTIIVLVGDHGTEFYEHGRFDHGHTLYDELVHVPLIFVVPGYRGVVVDKQISTINVFPTILDILKLEKAQKIQEQLAGKSLVSYFDSEGESEDVFMETDYRNFIHARAIRTADNMKYILTLGSNKEELYDLTADPYETNNLVTKKPELAATLRARLMTHLDDMGGVPVFSTDCLPVYDSQCK